MVKLICVVYIWKMKCYDRLGRLIFVKIYDLFRDCVFCNE